MNFTNNFMTVFSTPAHVKCYSYHARTSVIVSGEGGKQQCIIKTQMKYTNYAKSKMDVNMHMKFPSASSKQF